MAGSWRPSWSAVCALAAVCASARADDIPSAAAALRGAIRTLGRDVETWHYAYRPAARLPLHGAIPPDDPIVAAYLERRVSRYASVDAPAGPYAMSGGLYVAVDPVIGRTFGGIGESWALFRVPLRRGFRFVDVRAPGPDVAPAPLPREVRRTLARAGCRARTASALLVGLESRECHRIALRTLAELDVDGILYPYQAIDFRQCPVRERGAFIVLRTAHLGDGRIFTHELAGAPTEDHRLVEALFDLAREAGALHPSPWVELRGAAAPDDVRAWMREHLFGCGGWPEDTPPGDANASDGARRWNDERVAAPAASTQRPPR